MKRTIQTAEALGVPYEQWKALNEIDAVSVSPGSLHTGFKHVAARQPPSWGCIRNYDMVSPAFHGSCICQTIRVYRDTILYPSLLLMLFVLLCVEKFKPPKYKLMICLAVFRVSVRR